MGFKAGRRWYWVIWEQVPLRKGIRKSVSSQEASAPKLRFMGDFQVLEGGGNGMESKKQGPRPPGTRQISKPGVRPGTRGLPSSRNGSMLHSRVLS